MKIVLALAVAALICTHLPAHSQTDGAAVTLQNPGFEEPVTALPVLDPSKKAQITGLLADGWQDNSDWADISVEYSKDTENPHGGQSSQKVDVTRVTSGAVQIKQSVDFQANHQYIFRVWMKGSPGTSVSLQLRKATEPYTTYVSTDAKLSEEWREFTVSGGVPDDSPGFLLFLSSRPMTFWIDDAKLEDLTNSTTSPL